LKFRAGPASEAAGSRPSSRNGGHGAARDPTGGSLLTGSGQDRREQAGQDGWIGSRQYVKVTNRVLVRREEVLADAGVRAPGSGAGLVVVETLTLVPLLHLA